VGLTDFSFVRAFRVPESTGIDFLDGLVAGNVARIRFGRVLHTFLATADGRLAADCFVANNDQELIFLCESILPDAELDALLQAQGSAAAGLEDLTSTHVLLSLDGVQAWKVVKKLFGSDVLGLPYLSLELYPFEQSQVRLFRVGKTSEFGYLLLVPLDAAEALWTLLRKETEAVGGRLCGVDIHDELRLEGRFFNIHAEGRRVGDPLVLGLQWMIDFEKPSFLGSAPIFAQRAAGLQRKILGVALPVNGSAPDLGMSLYAGSSHAGEIVATCFSNVLGHPLGLVVAPAHLAYSGLTFRLGDPQGPPVRSISMPPILPKSLGIKLDEM
jgi:aminomethyltransferase